MYVLGLFKGIFGLLNTYFVVVGLFLPNTEEINLKKKLPTENNLKKYFKKTWNMDKGGRGGVSRVDNI